MTSNSGGVGSLPDTGSRKCSGQASPAQDREGPWRGLLVPLTGLFRGCEGRCGNAGTQGVFLCDVRHSLLPSPILLGLAPDCRRIRVLHLEPIGRPAGAVGRTLALGHDAFEAKQACRQGDASLSRRAASLYGCRLTLRPSS
jgi:hypothetical protein